MGKKIKKMTFNFPLGEDDSTCDKIARYADSISNFHCSGGGLEVVRMPINDEGIEFSEDTMVYEYDTPKGQFTKS